MPTPSPTTATASLHQLARVLESAYITPRSLAWDADHDRYVIVCRDRVDTDRVAEHLDLDRVQASLTWEAYTTPAISYAGSWGGMSVVVEGPARQIEQVTA